MQVRAGNTGRVELLDLAYDIFHFIVAYRQLLLEHDIVHQLLGRTSQIAVVVYVPQHPFCDVALRLGHMGEVDLRFEFLDQRATADDRYFPSVFIRRTVGLLHHITRCLIIRDILLVVEILVLQRVALTSLVVTVFGHVVIVELILL